MSLNINLVSFNFYKKNFNQSSQHNLNNSILLIYIYIPFANSSKSFLPSPTITKNPPTLSKYFYQNGQFTKNLQTEKSPYLQLYHFTKTSFLFPFQLSPKFVQFPITSIPSRGKIIVLFHRPQNRGISIGNPKPDR